MARKRATYEDLRRLPEHVIGELIGGELVVSPRPAGHHMRTGTMMTAGLVGPFDRDPDDPGGPGGWWIGAEPELHLHGDVLVPDLAGWRRERLPRIPAGVGVEIPPDWVCEIASPSTALIDRARKLPIYAREKVSWVWLVEPVQHIIDVFRREGDKWVLVETHGVEPKARIAPFDAVELEIVRWWLEPLPEPPDPTKLTT
jgi:Uma2 family endonuclease